MLFNCRYLINTSKRRADAQVNCKLRVSRISLIQTRGLPEVGSYIMKLGIANYLLLDGTTSSFSITVQIKFFTVVCETTSIHSNAAAVKADHLKGPNRSIIISIRE